MKLIWKLIIGMVSILILGAIIAWFGFLKPEPPPISDEDRQQLTLMPLPAELTLERGFFKLDSRLEVDVRGGASPRLEKALGRFFDQLGNETGVDLAFESGVPGGDQDAQLVIAYEHPSETFPALGDDESYSLKVSEKAIVLKAPGETGILFGLETLLQLVVKEGANRGIPALTISDQPRYPWRGLMVDVCRHWIPKDVILRILDGMAAAKMNVLHWHLTEYQGFRVESKLYPRLHEMGSNGNYYTHEDIREVVSYAADRGIRVVPEFDLPGHSTSWFVGYPELASAPGPYRLDSVFGVLKPLMDPTREEVYDFLDRFFGEMSTLFPDDYFHIGGDEVATDHWEENSAIQQFMNQKDLDDAQALQAYFNTRLHKILEGHGKKMMGWDEILHPDLPAEGVAVQSWRDQSSLWEAARKGSKAVLSAGYYLDHKQPAGFHYNVDPAFIPGAVNIEIDSSLWRAWDGLLQLTDMSMDASLYLFGEEERQGIMTFMEGTFVMQDIIAEGNHLAFTIGSSFGDIHFDTRMEADSLFGEATIALFKMKLTASRSGGSDMAGGKPLPPFTVIEPLTGEQEVHLIGGEACQWSEMVDQRTIESRIWPRAAAVAEKLWSPRSLTGNTEDMYRRLMVFDNRLGRRGMQHQSYREGWLRDWSDGAAIEPLHNLIMLLQEDRFFNRMVIYDPQLYTHTPLNRVVDAAPAESYEAYRFAEAVDNWLETGDSDTEVWLEETLESWSGIHAQLADIFVTTPLLREVEPHAIHLSRLGELGLNALAGLPSPMSDSIRSDLFEKAVSAYGGTVLKVVEPVQKLAEQAPGN
jgi:hexosaminidase